MTWPKRYGADEEQAQPSRFDADYAKIIRSGISGLD